MEFLGVWERLNNPSFNPVEFDGIRMQASLNSFVFSTVNERSILRFLKLIAADNGKIGTYAKLVDDRIQTHSKPVIEHCYREFLLQNHDTDEREYPDAADQIREVLIHGNYLSQKDIEICLGVDAESRTDHPGSEGMRELHAALVETYKAEDATSAA